MCVCASPGRPRALVAVGARVTPPLALASAGPSARGHARCLPSRPLCVRADSSRPGRGRPGCVGAPSALVSQPLSGVLAPPPHLGVSPSLRVLARARVAAPPAVVTHPLAAAPSWGCVLACARAPGS